MQLGEENIRARIRRVTPSVKKDTGGSFRVRGGLKGSGEVREGVEEQVGLSLGLEGSADLNKGRGRGRSCQVGR